MTNELKLNGEYSVIADNDLIRSKSTLSLNATKLLRLAIMQVVKSDSDFKTFQVRLTDLADFLQIDHNNLYRDVKNICKELLQQLVEVGDGNPKHKWKMWQWCSEASYEDGSGILTVRLHDHMKPYLLGLAKNYTSYLADNVMFMKSVYAIRVYELIKCEMKLNKNIPVGGVKVYLSLDVMRRATDTQEKFEKINDFKKKVLDISVREINDKANFNVTYEPCKKGKKIVGFYFICKSHFEPKTISPEFQKKLDQIDEERKLREMGQMNIFDFPQYCP